jgi:hypothetical protein
MDAPEMESAAESIGAMGPENPEPGAEMDVEILLAKLPEKYRQVITLFYLQQKAYEEVAQMLGIPVGTVKTILFRGKKELLRINNRQGQHNPNEPGPSPTGRRQVPAAVAEGLAPTLLSPQPIRM